MNRFAAPTYYIRYGRSSVFSFSRWATKQLFKAVPDKPDSRRTGIIVYAIYNAHTAVNSVVRTLKHTLNNFHAYPYPKITHDQCISFL